MTQHYGHGAVVTRAPAAGWRAGAGKVYAIISAQPE